MGTFRRLFLVAACAGLLAGLAATLLHQVTTVPLIERAEAYETHGAEAPGSEGHTDAPAIDAHTAPAWMPAGGLQRIVASAITQMLAGVGYSLLLGATAAGSGRRFDARRGLLWGLAGFAVFSLAPALGLPPALPGQAEAGLAERQGWWLLTVSCSAAGLAAVCFARRRWIVLSGLALLVLPHLVGAPHPAQATSPVPAVLTGTFVLAVIGSNLLFWLALGSLTGWVHHRLAQPAPVAAGTGASQAG
jgi:cobalt transporter subunit CbtA